MLKWNLNKSISSFQKPNLIKVSNLLNFNNFLFDIEVWGATVFKFLVVQIKLVAIFTYSIDKEYFFGPKVSHN